MKRRWGFVVGLAAVIGLACLSKQVGPAAVVQKFVQGIGIVIARIREQSLSVVRLWIRDHALRRIQGVSPADTSWVAPQLYVGGQQYPHGLARMAARSISASLSLRDEADDRARGVALERHLCLPTLDDTPPTLEQLGQAAQFVQQAIDEGRGVYIHCAAGVGRAPTAAAAYLVSTGLTPTEAWAQIRRGRPFIRPKVSQLEQLERFYQWKHKAGELQVRFVH